MKEPKMSQERSLEMWGDKQPFFAGVHFLLQKRIIGFTILMHIKLLNGKFFAVKNVWLIGFGRSSISFLLVMLHKTAHGFSRTEWMIGRALLVDRTSYKTFVKILRHLLGHTM
jgi:hypothetical protein